MPRPPRPRRATRSLARLSFGELGFFLEAFLTWTPPGPQLFFLNRTVQRSSATRTAARPSDRQLAAEGVKVSSGGQSHLTACPNVPRLHPSHFQHLEVSTHHFAPQRQTALQRNGLQGLCPRTPGIFEAWLEYLDGGRRLTHQVRTGRRNDSRPSGRLAAAGECCGQPAPSSGSALFAEQRRPVLPVRVGSCQVSLFCPCWRRASSAEGSCRPARCPSCSRRRLARRFVHEVAVSGCSPVLGGRGATGYLCCRL